MSAKNSARRALLISSYRPTYVGRDILKLLHGSYSQAAEAAEKLKSVSNLASRLSSRMSAGLLRQGDIARRVGALFQEKQNDAAWLLLDTSLDAAKDGHVLVRTKAKRLLVEGKQKEMYALAENYLSKKGASQEGLRALAYGLDRVSGSATAKIMDRTVQHYFASAAHRKVSRSRAEAKFYETLGLNAFSGLVVGEPLRLSGKVSVTHRRKAVDRELYHGDLDRAIDGLQNEQLDSVSKYEPANRLLLIGNTLAGGGMERILARTYRHFRESGTFENVDLALLDYSKDSALSFYAEEAGVTEEDVLQLRKSGPVDPVMRELPKSWQARCQHLFEHIRDTRPRVIHAWNDLTGLLAAYGGLLAGCPRIMVHFHHGSGVPLANRAEPVASYPAAYRSLIDRKDIHLLFCANTAAREYADWWAMPHTEDFHTIYNGFDWPEPVERDVARNKLGLPLGVPIIGTVMRFAPVKQPWFWAQAAIMLAKQKPDAHFVMAGEGGALGETIAARFASAGLADRLHMPGQVSNIADYYAAMDIFWLTSRTEGLPNVCIEAQFSAVPVGAFDVGGVGETIDNGRTGFLVPAGDFGALAEQTGRLLADPERMTEMGFEARVRANELFSSKIFFAKLSALYEA